ncbi:MAG: hypothetical protein ABIE84_07315 [bacterium]
MLKKIGYGLVIWVVPFVSAIPLMGLMTSDPIFFKTLMLVIGGVVGSICTVLYFGKVSGNYINEGIVLGITWLLVNWLLDYFLLLPLSKMSIDRYFMEIGLRYLPMPMTTIVVGYVLAKRKA